VTDPTIVIEPPVAAIGIVSPAGDVPSAFATPMEVPVVFAEIVTVTTAATPFGIMFVFSPVNKHV
jgi:hypothetical protein